MIHIIFSVIVFISVFVMPPPVAAQAGTCSGGSVTFANPVQVCRTTGKYGTAGRTCDVLTNVLAPGNCECASACPAIKIKELCGDYNNSKAGCESVNVARITVGCGAGACTWIPAPVTAPAPQPQPQLQPQPQPNPKPGDTDCHNGQTCNGTAITGTNGQIVCGLENTPYICKSGTWDYAGGSCEDHGQTSCAAAAPPAPVCGNAQVEAGEICDHGSLNGVCPALCTSTCQAGLCGIPQPPGPAVPVCGNAQVETGEACDEGSANGSCPSPCSTSCTVNSACNAEQTVCGNGAVEDGEQCDPGVNKGACPFQCSADCKLNSCAAPDPQNPGTPVCGNGNLESGEVCDAGANNGQCPAQCSGTCTLNSCQINEPPTATSVPTVTPTPTLTPIPPTPGPIACNQIAPSQRWTTQVLCTKKVPGCFDTAESKNFTIPTKAEFVKLVSTAILSGNPQTEECARVTSDGKSVVVCRENSLGQTTAELAIPVAGAPLKVDVNHLLEDEFPRGAFTVGSMVVRTDALFCGKPEDTFDPAPPTPLETIDVRVRVRAPSLMDLSNAGTDNPIYSRVSVSNGTKMEIDRTVLLMHQGNGIFSGDFSVSARLGAGNTAFVKVPKHLRVQKENVTFASGLNIIDFTATPLPAGDVAEEFGVIDSFDIATIRAMAGLTSPKNLAVADINGDGSIDDTDLQFAVEWLNYRFSDGAGFSGAKGNQQGSLIDAF